MSKTKGILYHIGGRLRKDKGWSEKESDNPPDKFWEGEIENKLPNGFGTYTHTNGTIYVGQYKDGLREGEGTWTLFNGKKFVGIWEDISRYFPNENVTFIELLRILLGGIFGGCLF